MYPTSQRALSGLFALIALFLFSSCGSSPTASKPNATQSSTSGTFATPTPTPTPSPDATGSMTVIDKLADFGVDGTEIDLASPSPHGWNKIPYTCAHTTVSDSGVTNLCDPNTDSPTYFEINFAVSSTNDMFFLTGGIRSCDTTVATRQCDTPDNFAHTAQEGGASYAFMVYNAAGTQQYLYQDFYEGTASDTSIATGTAFVTGLPPGNYVADMKFYNPSWCEATDASGKCTQYDPLYFEFFYGRQFALYKVN